MLQYQLLWVLMNDSVLIGAVFLHMRHRCFGFMSEAVQRCALSQSLQPMAVFMCVLFHPRPYQALLWAGQTVARFHGEEQN